MSGRKGGAPGVSRVPDRERSNGDRPTPEGGQDVSGRGGGTKGRASLESQVVGKIIDLPELFKADLFADIDRLGNGVVHEGTDGGHHVEVAPDRDLFGRNEGRREVAAVSGRLPETQDGRVLQKEFAGQPRLHGKLPNKRKKGKKSGEERRLSAKKGARIGRSGQGSARS